MKVPDLCPERWLCYLVAAAGLVLALAILTVSDTQRLWAVVVLGGLISVAEAIASAWTRAARAPALTQFGIDESRLLSRPAQPAQMRAVAEPAPAAPTRRA